MFFFFQAEDGIRYLVRSRGLGDVYKRQQHDTGPEAFLGHVQGDENAQGHLDRQDDGRKQRLTAKRLMQTRGMDHLVEPCLLYTSDAADERSSVDLGGRRIIKKKNKRKKKKEDKKNRTKKGNTQYISMI